MSLPSSSRRPFVARFLAGLLAAVFVVGAVGWLPAQNSKKEEEEETTKPKKKPPVVEEEEEKPARPRKVIKVDDEEPTPTKPKPHLQPPPEPEVQSSLDEALHDAKNLVLRGLYTDMSKPHDLLTVRGINDESITYAIEPLTHYYAGQQPHFKNGYVEVRSYDAEWHLAKTSTKYHSALRIQPYEEVAIDAVDELLKKNAAQLGLTRAEMLKAAETVLAKADRYHASAHGREGQGEEWQPVGKRLHDRLFEVQLERLRTFTDAKDWDGAAAYARTLARAYAGPEERAPIAAPLVRMIQDGLPGNSTDEQLRVASDRFRQLEDVFPGSQAIQPIARGLRVEAKRLLDQAKGLKDGAEARQRIDLAAQICPTLPELAEELARMNQDHPILRVGVRELPSRMVPGQAVTDADLRAVELMYEGLVKLREEPGVGQGYEPGLCGGAPRLVPLGREFRIARGAAWADGSPVTAGDVKETLRFMKTERWVGYSPMWNKLVNDAEGGGDSFRLSVRLRQGYLDPLSLMTFKVMPQAAARPAAAAVAPKPDGSGPFKLLAAKDAGDKTLRFVANPAYASREGKLGLPRIKEIYFTPFAGWPDEAEKALKDGRIDLLLDVGAKRVKELRSAGKWEVRGPMSNRRVYFLAVNHRDARINGNVALRQALAQAIDREALLDKFYRDEPGGKMHHALNGPFPAGSWPCEPKRVPAKLYNAEGAKAQVREAVKAAGGAIELTVKFPTGDPTTLAAVTALCEAVSTDLHLDDNTYIKLKPLGVEPHQLRRDVEGAHQYEVAYYHYDHPSKAFWVAPLFDIGATDINGSNYLGYFDPELQAELEKAKNRRDFSEVQQTMHRVHQMLAEKMPLVPLWQLDAYIAYRPGVDFKEAAVDPLLIFNDVEKWKLEGKRN
jgi:ABC-type transport system substrate-binding protein